MRSILSGISSTVVLERTFFRNLFLAWWEQAMRDEQMFDNIMQVTWNSSSTTIICKVERDSEGQEWLV